MKFCFLLLLSCVCFAKIKNYDDLSLKKCGDDCDFTIHGLWPEYSSGGWPQWCNPLRYHEFNETVITPLRPKLNMYWYSCPEWNISSYTFWKHEWKKHGTCIPNINVIDYFNHTINTYLQSKDKNFYDCCNSNNSQCLIPFSKNLRWLGYCHTTKIGTTVLTDTIIEETIVIEP
jgi:ribonuclease I